MVIQQLYYLGHVQNLGEGVGTKLGFAMIFNYKFVTRSLS
jgi:hypothetical protein